jgi:diaminohydroxyphosphoribosylaminopyrimidine deaminase/5-amino-6-(5-phosphoribosylamino)uracil reductase
MIGIGTALADDPLLTCRLPGMAKNSPVRVVLDSALRLPPSSRLVQTARQTPLWLIAGPTAPRAAEEGLRAHGAEVLRAGESGGRLDLAVVLKILVARGITRLMVEGGPTLGAALIAADLVDEAIFFHAAKVVGAGGLDALDAAVLMALTRRLKCVTSEPVGADRQDLYERG